MARPRHWEMGEGAVDALVPMYEDFDLYKRGELTLVGYRELYLARSYLLEHPLQELAPGRLRATMYVPALWKDIEDGDTLLCCCSKADAAAGKCHRVWAAELLRKAGWTPIVDGREMKGVDEQWRPIWRETARGTVGDVLEGMPPELPEEERHLPTPTEENE